VQFCFGGWGFHGEEGAEGKGLGGGATGEIKTTSEYKSFFPRVGGERNLFPLEKGSTGERIRNVQIPRSGVNSLLDQGGNSVRKKVPNHKS